MKGYMKVAATHQPLSNLEIQKISPEDRGQCVVIYLSLTKLDTENCKWRGRNLDNLWENGDFERVAESFAYHIEKNEKAKENAIFIYSKEWLDDLQVA